MAIDWATKVPEDAICFWHETGNLLQAPCAIHAFFLASVTRRKVLLIHPPSYLPEANLVERTGFSHITVDKKNRGWVDVLFRKRCFFIALKGRNLREVRWVRKYHLPVLFVATTEELVAQYRSIFLSISSHPDSKYRILWSAFFARHFHSQINLPCLSQVGVRSKIQNAHLGFAKRVYQKYKVRAKLKMIKILSNVSEDGILTNISEKYPYALYLFSISSSYNPLLDALFGSNEHSLLKKTGKSPILLLATYEEGYLPCDR